MSKKIMMVLLFVALTTLQFNAFGWSAGACDGKLKSILADQMMKAYQKGAVTYEEAQTRCDGIFEIVWLKGKVVHFGVDLTKNPPENFPYDLGVSGALVYIANYPLTRYLNIKSDSLGYWRMPVIKLKNVPLEISLVYEKEGFVTTKSQIITIQHDNMLDLAIQLPDVLYYAVAKGQIEQQVSQMIGAPYTLHNIMVTTVGKSWASMFSNELPHGDPGAVVSISPAIQFPSLGPIYFNEMVVPDPTRQVTSVDGGVLFGNVPVGINTLTATKAPYQYSPVKFSVEDGIELYIASPPHCIIGNNSSPAGNW